MKSSLLRTFYFYFQFFHGHVPGKNTLTRRVFRRKPVKSVPQHGACPKWQKIRRFFARKKAPDSVVESGADFMLCYISAIRESYLRGFLIAA